MATTLRVPILGLRPGLLGFEILGLGAKFWFGGKILDWGNFFGPGQNFGLGAKFWVRGNI